MKYLTSCQNNIKNNKNKKQQSTTCCCELWSEWEGFRPLISWSLFTFHITMILSFCLITLLFAILDYLSVQGALSITAQNPSSQCPDLMCIWSFSLPPVHSRPIQSYKVFISSGISFVFSKVDSHCEGQV